MKTIARVMEQTVTIKYKEKTVLTFQPLLIMFALLVVFAGFHFGFILYP